MSARVHTRTLCSGIWGIAVISGFGSMYHRSVGGNLMSTGFRETGISARQRRPKIRAAENHISILGCQQCLPTAVRAATPRVRLHVAVPRAQRMLLGPSARGPSSPRLERILDVGEAGISKLRIVAQNHGLEVGLVDPAQGPSAV